MMNADTPVFAIAAAAELSGLHPQTLRQYDRIGSSSPDALPAVRAGTPPGTSSSCARSPSSLPRA